jgi:hypothetical protein
MTQTDELFTRLQIGAALDFALRMYVGRSAQSDEVAECFWETLNATSQTSDSERVTAEQVHEIKLKGALLEIWADLFGREPTEENRLRLRKARQDFIDAAMALEIALFGDAP